MKIKIIQTFVGQKNERVSEDSSVIPEGTTLNVSDERGETLIELGYARKVIEHDYSQKVINPARKKK